VTLSRRNFLRLLGLGGAGLALGPRPGWAGTRPAPAALRLLATSRSVSSSVIAAFTNATGVPVKLELGSSSDLAGYDLAIVPAHTLVGLVRCGLVRELDPISPPYPLEQRAYDPLNAFSLPAGRGLIGINSRDIAAPVSWAEFFARARAVPAHLPPTATFNAALKSLGHSINTRDTLARARARNLVSMLNSAPLTEARLTLGAPLPDWTFTLPVEGAELWEDCFCIPADSAQPDLAHDFIRPSLSAHPPNAISVTDVPLEMLSPFAPQI